MQTAAYRYELWIWTAVAVVWLLGSLTAKRAARVESARSRIQHLILSVLAFALIFGERVAIGPLRWRLVPSDETLAWCGLVLTAAGAAFTIWARFMLGGNWSGSVTVKKNHQLVRRGPYRIVRHPIYCGALTGLFGTALTIGELRGFLGVALALYGWHAKSKVEESFMMQQFGARYEAYQAEVKALIPFLF